MRSTPCRRSIVSCLLLIAFVAGLHAVECHAQDAASTPPTETAPAPAVFHNPIPSAQLAFLNDYTGKSSKDALKDKRFHGLNKLFIPRTTYHYGTDMSLKLASEDVLDGKPLPVTIREGRYVMIASQGGMDLSGRGFLWFDIQEGIALGGVYFHPTNGEPTPTLAIFSSQLSDTSLTMSQLPAEFAQDLASWIIAAKLRYVSPRYFIPQNGKKYPLLHDEDYCNQPTGAMSGAAAPDPAFCQQLNAEAADADLEATDFMNQTHNAANATAWMLSPVLSAWIGTRNQSCGVSYPCRIRLTRQRTRTLLTQQRQ